MGGIFCSIILFLYHLKLLCEAHKRTVQKWRDKDGKGEEKLCHLDLNDYSVWWEGGIRNSALDSRNSGMGILIVYSENLWRSISEEKDDGNKECGRLAEVHGEVESKADS